MLRQLVKIDTRQKQYSVARLMLLLMLLMLMLLMLMLKMLMLMFSFVYDHYVCTSVAGLLCSTDMDYYAYLWYVFLACTRAYAMRKLLTTLPSFPQMPQEH